MKVGFDTFRETGNAKSALIDAIAHLGMIFIIYNVFRNYYIIMIMSYLTHPCIFYLRGILIWEVNLLWQRTTGNSKSDLIWEVILFER